MVETRRKVSSLLDERRLCGSLLAKVSRDEVEILCRRCKRIHRIRWPGGKEEGSCPIGQNGRRWLDREARGGKSRAQDERFADAVQKERDDVNLVLEIGS